MTILLTGATGMVGKGVLLEALDDPTIREVRAVGRRSCGVEHPNLREIIHDDFLDYSAIAEEFDGVDACFWCLGISSVGVDDETYDRITRDFTIAAAELLHERSPEARFCFVSGEGTDQTESSRMRWARVKGRTENDLKKIGFRQVILFRPGLIRPMRGIRPNDRLQKIAYTLLFPIMALLPKLGLATTTVAVGQAMLAAARGEVEMEVVGNREINRVV